MQVTVYWDVLWAVNFLLDSVLLACTAFFTAKQVSVFRILLAGGFGATYALCPLFEATDILYNPFIKILIAFVMVALAMRFNNGLDYLKTTVLFFMVSFFAGGLALALNNLGGSYFIFSQGKLLLLALFVASFLVLAKTLYFRLRALLMNSACKMTVRISIGEKYTQTTAILDTGNELACPLTGKPIIIVNSEVLADLLPVEMLQAKDFSGLTDLSNAWKERIQILPYSALGNKGLLIAVRPDKTEIGLFNAPALTEVYALVGIANEEFCNTKNYKALVSSQLLPALGGAVA